MSSINRLLLRERRPGYISLPTDVARATLQSPPGAFKAGEVACDDASLEAMKEDVSAFLARSKSTVVLAEFLADRFQVHSELNELIASGNFRHATLALGKGVVDESSPRFLGTYAGSTGFLDNPIRDIAPPHSAGSRDREDP
jgi:indolepyruvate decarboxylase